ncbi:hypothetical protein GE061_007812 [Apolygus lucorum]|uniref:MaoC-like domain-containing protein n=1 Tax=Apolygus lucorum TaxID=248454 RepID=A0A8S9WQH8_APOLU|nr:hypothetical protein GE061_007812 [Apolygus lucorum]
MTKCSSVLSSVTRYRSSKYGFWKSVSERRRESKYCCLYSQLGRTVLISGSWAHNLFRCRSLSTESQINQSVAGELLVIFPRQTGDTNPVHFFRKADGQVHDVLNNSLPDVIGPKSATNSQRGRESSTGYCLVDAEMYPGRFGLPLCESPVRRSSWGHNLFTRRSLSTESQTEQSVVIERLVTREDVESFARLSGDTNPIHLTGKAIVHGALLNSFLSGVIGTKLPGPGTILVSQTFKFPHPCHIGDTIIIQVSITDVRKISVCQYHISRKSDNQCLMEGEAKVIVVKDHHITEESK